MAKLMWMSCSFLYSSCPGETAQRRGGQRLLCVLLLLLWGGQVSIFASRLLRRILRSCSVWKQTHHSFNGDGCYDNVANIDEKVGDVKTVVFGEQRKMIIVVDDDDNNDDDWWRWQLPSQLASSAGELLEPGRLPCLHPLQGFFWRSTRLCCHHNERNLQNSSFPMLQVSIECLSFH